jgi:hypothetical protein
LGKVKELTRLKENPIHSLMWGHICRAARRPVWLAQHKGGCHKPDSEVRVVHKDWAW